MIGTLRIKFIAVAMSSIFVVLLVIMGTINVMGYLGVNQKADKLLAVLSENDGLFPKPDHKKGDREPPKAGFGPETPYETRYFSVLIGPEGNAQMVNTGAIAAISSGDAIAYAEEIFYKGFADGFIGDYKYAAVPSGENTLILFLDCGKDFATLRSFFFTCLLVSAGGLLAVFLLVLLFSKIALRPIAEGYRKQKQFITDASHEIKTPLTIIDANTEVLEMEGGGNQWTQSTRKQIRRLTELTNALVALTRMDEEGAGLQMTLFSLSDAVAETTAPFEPLAQNCGKVLLLDIEQGLSYTGNEDAIRRMVAILMDNAFKYTDNGGHISLLLQKFGKKCRLQVCNTVESIEIGNQEHLFERFYRRDSSRSTGGFGIGLSIAKAAAEAHRGKITAASPDGKSLLITVIL